MILLWFVLENRDENDMLHDILMRTAGEEKLDLSRVYITGHSHDGSFATEYAFRHPGDIAALATLGNTPGLRHTEKTMPFFIFNSERCEEMRQWDIPTVNICGCCEFRDMIPLYDAGDHRRAGQTEGNNDIMYNVESWKARLRAYCCPPRTTEEILATKNSRSKVERVLGIPADKKEILYMDGYENYIADIRNEEGRYHLRMIALQNMPHTVTPLMIDLSWSFLCRFARNLKNGETVELYEP